MNIVAWWHCWRNPNHKRGPVVICKKEVHYLYRVGKGMKSIGLFPIGVLLELDLTRLLDEVANVAAARSKEISATVTRDTITSTSTASLKCLYSG